MTSGVVGSEQGQGEEWPHGVVGNEGRGGGERDWCVIGDWVV